MSSEIASDDTVLWEEMFLSKLRHPKEAIASKVEKGEWDNTLRYISSRIAIPRYL